MRINSQGQAFHVFRLLIGAILGLAILVIIISIIGYLEVWKVDVSKQQLFEGLNTSIQSPNGETVIRKNLTIAKDTVFTANGFAQNSGLEPDCIELQASRLSAFDLQGNFLKLKSNILTSVYYQCIKKPSYAPNCDIYCKISFGQEPV